MELGVGSCEVWFDYVVDPVSGIGFVTPPTPEPGAVTSNTSIEVNVSINGTVVLTANDRGFRDRFDGFIFRNGGGDYLVKSISGYSK